MKMIPFNKIPKGCPPSLLVESALHPHHYLETSALSSWLKAQVLPPPIRQDTLLWLVDLRTLAHPIARQLEKYEGNLSPSAFARLRWSIALSAIPEEVRQRLPSHVDKVRIVLADDCPAPHPDHTRPVYWRHHVVPEYKAGRPEKPRRWDIITTEAYGVASTLGIPVVSSPYFEADDFIAVIVNNLEWFPDVAATGIYTVDTDLMQLIDDDKGVFWFNVGPWLPVLRDGVTALEYWLKRWKRPITHPREIALDKSIHGDKSDNLAPGTDLRVIDLHNPAETPFLNPDDVLFYPPTPLETLSTRLRAYQLEAMLAGVPVGIS